MTLLWGLLDRTVSYLHHFKSDYLFLRRVKRMKLRCYLLQLLRFFILVLRQSRERRTHKLLLSVQFGLNSTVLIGLVWRRAVVPLIRRFFPPHFFGFFFFTITVDLIRLVHFELALLLMIGQMFHVATGLQSVNEDKHRVFILIVFAGTCFITLVLKTAWLRVILRQNGLFINIILISAASYSLFDTLIFELRVLNMILLLT